MAFWRSNRNNRGDNISVNMLYVSNCFSFSPTHAASVTTLEIVKRLTERGHRVTVFVPRVEGHGVSKDINVVSLAHSDYTYLDVESYLPSRMPK